MDQMIAEARRNLLARRRMLARLRRESEEQERALQESRGVQDWIDDSVAYEEKQFLARLSESERHELQQIDRALERVEDGSYGTCQSCGHAIGRQRLRAIPEASECVSCSSLHELAA